VPIVSARNPAVSKPGGDYRSLARPTVPVPSINETPMLRLLPLVLSLIAGSCDIIGFIGLGGLFTAHITGNLVVLAARLVAGESAPLSYLISVPVFILVLGLTRLLVNGLERFGVPSLRPLLLLQLLLLGGFLASCVAVGSPVDPNAVTAIVAGMLGVSAMAVQTPSCRYRSRARPRPR
jgi:uncharacterized membrane protein YoaK (UPF0700 family)